MRTLLATLSTALVLAFLLAWLGGLTGCESAAPTFAPENRPDLKSDQPITVDGVALLHNERVDDLVRRFGPARRTGLPDFEFILQEWGETDRVDLPAARELWRLKDAVFARGFRPEDLHSLVQRGLDVATNDPDVRPAFLEQLHLCLDLLLENEQEDLAREVNRLAALARDGGTRREKEIAGIFLGSVLRAEPRVHIEPDHPWYPWIMGMDQVGELIGGPSMGALLSAEAEVIVCFYFTPWWWGI